MSQANHPFFDPRMAIGAAPVPGDRPAGADPRGGAEFEELEAEMRRMETDGPLAVNWRQVIALSSGIIETRGKDLLIGAWLTYGLTREEKLHGLSVGLGILKGMVAEHWEQMQPPAARERARVGILEWLVGRATPLCESEVQENDWLAALYAYDALSEIDALMSKRLTKEQVALGELMRALRPLRDTARRGLEERAKQAQAEAEARGLEAKAEEERTAQVTDARPDAPQPDPPQPGTSAQAASNPVASAATPASAPVAAAAIDLAVIDQLPDSLRSLSTALIARNPADPRAYLLSRIASWWRIRQLPPNEGGRTGAMPPVEEMATVAALRQGGQNEEALRALNDLVWTAPFWFEGHRLTAEILAALGPAHADAQATVAGAMNLLFRRFPALLGFSFSDGKPFADPATRDWIAENGGGGGTTTTSDPLDRVVAEARALVAGGKAPDAIEMLAGLTRGEIGGRARLLRQIAQARFCLDVGLIAPALPLLDHLEAMLNSHDLEAWEPALAVQVAELRFRALTHADASRLVVEERRRNALEETRLRLVRLDLATAARLFR
ncbi:type VI secretion system protein TssA [Bosea sp. R86505]|uniref:type VI secretion system protein TssA n=1 Tax=Bosea sp. R86505 TaxID=3101710 RepID=UPI0036708ACB